MNSIKIKILDKDLELEEARELYLELLKLFSKTDLPWYPPIVGPFQREMPPDWIEPVSITYEITSDGTEEIWG